VAEAYCVKCKAKREVKNPQQDHDEERQAGALGCVPGVLGTKMFKIGG